MHVNRTRHCPPINAKSTVAWVFDRNNCSCSAVSNVRISPKTPFMEKSHSHSIWPDIIAITGSGVTFFSVEMCEGPREVANATCFQRPLSSATSRQACSSTRIADTYLTGYWSGFGTSASLWSLVLHWGIKRASFPVYSANLLICEYDRTLFIPIWREQL